MYNFVIDKKNVNDQAVTGTYRNIIKKACSLVGETGTIANGEKPRNKRDYIISDTVQTACKYFFYGYKNQIVWMQGIVPEESFMRRHSKLRFWVLSFMERVVLKRGKLLLFVSDDMLLHYEKKYRLSLKEKSVIMPCFNETEITDDAFTTEKYQKNTFLYAGGMAKWQCFEQMVALYEKIENDDTLFYVYTFNKEVAKEILLKYNVKHYYVDCVSKEELTERIKGIKYGFVLREDCAVNHVATPTKFSNYLANGIIPIYSDSLHSFAAVDAEYKIGIVCNTDHLEQGAKSILDHMKTSANADEIEEKCRSVFDTYYNQDIYIEAIKQKLLLL